MCAYGQIFQRHLPSEANTTCTAGRSDHRLVFGECIELKPELLSKPKATKEQPQADRQPSEPGSQQTATTPHLEKAANVKAVDSKLPKHSSSTKGTEQNKPAEAARKNEPKHPHSSAQQKGSATSQPDAEAVAAAHALLQANRNKKRKLPAAAPATVGTQHRKVPKLSSISPPVTAARQVPQKLPKSRAKPSAKAPLNSATAAAQIASVNQNPQPAHPATKSGKQASQPNSQETISLPADGQQQAGESTADSAVAAAALSPNCKMPNMPVAKETVAWRQSDRRTDVKHGRLRIFSNCSPIAAGLLSLRAIAGVAANGHRASLQQVISFMHEILRGLHRCCLPTCVHAVCLI